jgi:uncharacterized protein YutE (UPF0331/DUF86 family)
MVEKDVVMAKIAVVQRCLRRIQATTQLDPASLENIDKQDIFILNLQRAVQAVIDLAAHVVASEGLGLPETIRDNFRLLKEKGILSANLASKMEKMTAFRNIVIHDYQSIKEEVLKSILVRNLPELEQFYSAVLKYYNWDV